MALDARVRDGEQIDSLCRRATSGAGRIDCDVRGSLGQTEHIWRCADGVADSSRRPLQRHRCLASLAHHQRVRIAGPAAGWRPRLDHLGTLRHRRESRWRTRAADLARWAVAIAADDPCAAWRTVQTQAAHGTERDTDLFADT